MPLIIKINVRHSTTGSPIRTLGRFTNYNLNLRHNSIASTFSVNFLYDPQDRNQAEMICVSHLHECIVYHTTNEDPNYQVTDKDRKLTGLLMFTGMKESAKPHMITVSGYSKAGVLNDCSHPPDMTLETEGLSLQAIIERSASAFNIGVVYDRSAIKELRALAVGEDLNEAGDGDDEEDIGKTAADSTQNVASYLTNLCKARNLVLNSDKFGRLQVTKSNTKGKPIMTLDFTNGADSEIYRKIPGLEVDLQFNAQAMHSHITVKMQSEDEEDSNGSEITIRNPLLPVAAVYRPITHTIDSGSEFTVRRAAKYELSKEIREAVKLTINMGKIDVDDSLVMPDNTIIVKAPRIYLYTFSRWYIQGVDITGNEKGENAALECVLPFAYDFDSEVAKNVFIDPHKNTPLT